MALLVEGLDVGGDTSIEEYIIGPANDLTDNQEPNVEKDQIKLYGPEAGLSWVAKPVTGQSSIGLVSRHGSMINRSMHLVDPLVTLFGSVHEKNPESGSMRSMLFPNFGSMFSMADSHVKHEQWDEEGLQQEGEDYASEADGDDYENNLQSPLLSRQATSMEKDTTHGSAISVRRHSSLMQENVGEAGSNMGIGGGWQLAWKWSEKEGQNGKKEGSFKRIYLHEGTHGSMRGSLVSLPGGDVPAESEYIQAAALVSQNALHSRDLMNQHAVGPAMVHPSETVSKAVSWDALLEPGVSRALVVGIGIQLLQQVGTFVSEILILPILSISFLSIY